MNCVSFDLLPSSNVIGAVLSIHGSPFFSIRIHFSCTGTLVQREAIGGAALLKQPVGEKKFSST